MADLAYQLPCPFCGCAHSRVIDVDRDIEATSSSVVMHTRRRRVCASCRQRFTTVGTERIVGRYTSSVQVTTIYRGTVSST